MKFIILLLFLSPLFTNAQMVFGKLPVGDTSTTPILIIIAGESNAGGIAPNDSATSAELLPRRLKILNNTTCASMDSFHIAVNNLIGHAGLGAYATTSHNFDCGIADYYDTGLFKRHPVYIVKCGQGGTLIGNWIAGGASYMGYTSYDTLKRRVDSSINIIERTTGRTPELYLFWSLGINDYNAGTSTSLFKSRCETFFTAFNSDYGVMPIFMMGLEFVSGNPYASQLSDLTVTFPNITKISTSGLTNIGDGIHLTHSGHISWSHSTIISLNRLRVSYY